MKSLIILVPVVAAFFFGPVRAADPAPMAPLVHAQAVSFKARVFFVASEPSGALRPGQTFLVQAKRPASLRVEDVSRAEDYKPTQEIILLPFSQLVSDGKTQIEVNPSIHVFVRWRAAPTLERIVSSGEMNAFLAPDVLFSPAPLRLFHEAAGSEVDGATVRIFRRTRTVKGVTFERRLYVARETGLPVRVSNFVADHPGRFTEGDRTDFSDWRLDPVLPASTFDPTPPAGMKPTRAAGQKEK